MQSSPQFDWTVRPVEPPTGKMRRHHGDDRVGLVVNPNGLAQNRWITMKFRLPESVADDHLELISPLLFLVGEEAPEQWLDAQDFEIARGNQPYRALFWLRRSIREADVFSPNIKCDDLFERMIGGGEVPHVQRGRPRNISILR